MAIVGKNVVMVVAPQNFRDEECLVPKELFEKSGINVTIASKGVSQAKGMLGATIKVDTDYSKVDVDAFDAVIFVGGSGASIYFEDPKAQKLADDFFNAGKVVAAICIAPTILANAGFLVSRNVTAFPSEQVTIENEGANYTGKDVEVDGKIVTAKGPHAAKKFAETILKLLG